jgi:hypothetical protein
MRSRCCKRAVRMIACWVSLCAFCPFYLFRLSNASGLDQNLDEQIRQRSGALENKLITWRDIHEHPELGDQEFRTAKLVVLDTISC